MISVINFGFINIHIYSIFLLLGLLIGWKLATIEAKKWNIPADFMFNLIFWTIIFGVIGARLYYVIFNFDYYSSNLLEIVQIWKGGLAIHGGIIFGLLFILIYCSKYKVSKLRILDIIVVSLLIAQAIGRWGNFFNGEAHGSITSLEYLESLFVPSFVINGMYINGAYYIPTFYFESLACFIGFIFLLFFRRRKYTKVGQVTSLYLIIYGCIRFFIECLRTDSLMFFDFKMAQIISILMVISGIVLFVICARKGTRFENLYNDEENGEDVRF